MSQNTEPLTLKVTEYATAANVSERAVYRAIEKKEIPAIRVGRAVRIPLWYFEQVFRPVA